MRLYRLLLRMYPSSFRDEYGDEMCAVFARRLREHGAAPGVWRLWLETVGDVVRTAAGTHADILRQDLRHTVRSLRRAKGFAMTAVLVVALGVGATTAVFSVADAVLIRPLPFPDPDRLAILWERHGDYGRTELSPANFRDWQQAATSFTRMAAFNALAAANLTGLGEPRRLTGSRITSEFLPTLGVTPLLGRGFAREDDRDGAPATVIISYRFWQAAFAGDPATIGRTLVLDGTPHAIVGIMPASFRFPTDETDYWAPLRLDRDAFEDRNNTFLHAVGRLAPGTTFDRARAEAAVIFSQLAQRYPKENAQTTARVVTMRDDLPQQSHALIVALACAAGGMLLIACANLGMLLLTRGIGRRRELAVRAALGAGPDRLARQLLTEGFVLAGAGGAAGAAAAAAAMPLLSRLVPSALPTAPPQLDLRALAFAAAATAVTALAFGLAPSSRLARRAGADSMRESVRGGPGPRDRLRAALVVAEIAASIVLLVSTGLLLRALWRIQRIDPGFEVRGVLVVRTPLPSPRYDTVPARRTFYRAVLDEVRALPGVSGAAYTTAAPIAMGGGIWPVAIGGAPADESAGQMASLRFVSPGSFAALGIALREGRDVADSDDERAPRVAIVSESFARRFFPEGGTRLGRTFTIAFADRRIIGIVSDIHVRGLEAGSEPQVYLPYLQQVNAAPAVYAPKDLIVRGSVAPDVLLPSIRAIVRRADPEQPIASARTMDEVVGAETVPRAVQLRVLGAFASLAFLLAAVGLHGVLSFSVSQRRREIGVRMALGAQRHDIVSRVVGRGLLLAAAGVVPGVALGYAAGRLLQSLLGGVAPGDPLTFGSVVALTVVMAFAGCLAPAVRAVRVDPIDALRQS